MCMLSAIIALLCTYFSILGFLAANRGMLLGKLIQQFKY